MTRDAAPRLLREVPGWRRVFRTRLGDQECVTRVLLSQQVDPRLAPLVEQVVMRGHGTIYGQFPDELLLTLEGYRVAARLPAQPEASAPWTHAVAAGVGGDGFIHISTVWIEGTPLHLLGTLSHGDAQALAVRALGILGLLHSHGVTYGDFKPENLVLRPDGSVALIDLDTLREVADATSWAPTRDLTPAWAAPEQEHERRTYLASDLWAWARLVNALFPAGVPDEWRAGLRACQQRDPLCRPSTPELLAHLLAGAPLIQRGGRPTPPAGGATERVPESVATQRVPEVSGAADTPAGPLSPGPPAVPRPRERLRWGCLQLGGLVLALPFFLCGGGWFAWDQYQTHRANAASEEVMIALKAYKTRPDLNARNGQREKILAMADRAWATRHTRRSSAVRALAYVWSQGWQDSNRPWSTAQYDTARKVIGEVQDADQAEAQLAEATLDGAACRLNRLDPMAAVACDRALAGVASLLGDLPDAAEHHWLRVEAIWTDVLVRSELVAQSASPDAIAHREAGRARCVEAEPWLPYAPVNGPELLQDCLRLAGGADALDQYIHWANLLLSADEVDGPASKATVWHVYAGVGVGCDTITVEERRGEWQVKGAPWCVAVGHAARGCWGAVALTNKGRDKDPSHPWDALDVLLANAVRLVGTAANTCVR